MRSFVKFLEGSINFWMPLEKGVVEFEIFLNCLVGPIYFW